MTQPREAIAAEYVADSPELMQFLPTEPISDLTTASEMLVDLLRARIGAVVENSDLETAMMLSGGVDSILVAAVCRDLQVPVHAVTVIADAEADSEDHRSRDVAAFLGIEHDVVHLSTGDVAKAAADCVTALGTDELWEITSAIPVRAAFDAVPADRFGPVLTGAGADALFMGGAHLAADPGSEAGLAEFRSTVTAKVRANFTRNRLIPDYYERLLDQRADQFVQTFQTNEFWRFAMSIDPALLWRIGPEGRAFDKYLLRFTAERLGVPAELVWTVKSPLQVSSGVIGSTVQAARELLDAADTNHTYADPLREPIEHTVSRLYLRELNR